MKLQPVINVLIKHPDNKGNSKKIGTENIIQSLCYIQHQNGALFKLGHVKSRFLKILGFAHYKMASAHALGIIFSYYIPIIFSSSFRIYRCFKKDVENDHVTGTGESGWFLFIWKPQLILWRGWSMLMPRNCKLYMYKPHHSN